MVMTYYYLREHPVPPDTDDAVVVVEGRGLYHVVGVVAGLRHDHLAAHACRLEYPRDLTLPNLLRPPVTAVGVNKDQ